MSPRWIRRIVIAVSIVGIAGMIAGSIADNNGIAITFGLITAVAVLGLILVTAAVGTEGFGAPRRSRPARSDEEAGQRLERRIEQLVGSGADERELRELVREAIQLGRRHAP